MRAPGGCSTRTVVAVRDSFWMFLRGCRCSMAASKAFGRVFGRGAAFVSGNMGRVDGWKVQKYVVGVDGKRARAARQGRSVHAVLFFHPPTARASSFLFYNLGLYSNHRQLDATQLSW